MLNIDIMNNLLCHRRFCACQCLLKIIKVKTKLCRNTQMNYETKDSLCSIYEQQQERILTNPTQIYSMPCSKVLLSK